MKYFVCYIASARTTVWKAVIAQLSLHVCNIHTLHDLLTPHIRCPWPTSLATFSPCSLAPVFVSESLFLHLQLQVLPWALLTLQQSSMRPSHVVPSGITSVSCSKWMWALWSALRPSMVTLVTSLGKYSGRG